MNTSLDAYAEPYSGHEAIKIVCNPWHAPTIWISELMTKTPKAVLRDVLIHIVEATFQVRCLTISNKQKPPYVCDSEAGSCGDFDVGGFSYHVACTSISALVRKCKNDLDAHRSPVLLVPEHRMSDTHLLAKRLGIKRRIVLFAVEGFLSRALLFQAVEQRQTVFESWRVVISEYNKDKFPKIELI
ncbi:MAG TPA: DUF4928 family protein [Terriglobales bacterium]|jgi:hypothetical protein|nr:DUF4928 family protein [Terriglobales bacterium]